MHYAVEICASDGRFLDVRMSHVRETKFLYTDCTAEMTLTFTRSNRMARKSRMAIRIRGEGGRLRVLHGHSATHRLISRVRTDGCALRRPPPLKFGSERTGACTWLAYRDVPVAARLRGRDQTSSLRDRARAFTLLDQAVAAREHTRSSDAV
eukprot:COSAG02_NODE_2352_length_9081_cov_37.519372_6_plen_152_part_00